MAYKYFYFAVLVRLTIIVILTAGATFLFLEHQAYFAGSLVLVVMFVAIYNIINYFNNVNKWVSLFLLGIENEDSTLKTPLKTGNKAIDDIYIGIERLNDIFKQTKMDISLQEHYFRTVINQSATGLFSLNEKGRVISINPAAEKLTRLKEYHHANFLKNIDNALPGFILKTYPFLHQKSAIFENKYGQKLLFKLSDIENKNEKIRLVAISDITKELDNGEVEAWIKLARTLSHEIMNSIVPVTTLSQVISGYFTANGKMLDVKDIDSKTIANTVKGLKVIEEQSAGLMNFVENYRKFTKLPEPQVSKVNLSDLIENNLLVANTFTGFGTIKINTSIPENVVVSTDEKLLSQVIINLLKNACEALIMGNTENPRLKINLKQTENSIAIEITNNGPCILPEIKEQIFIPFFTTKEEGSGVGLSLSKQIMLKMGGDILLYTTKDNLTLFVVSLRF